MPTRTIRSTVADRLIATVRQELPDVDVLEGATVDHPAEFVMLLEIVGDEHNTPTSKAGRLHRNDDFTLRWIIWVATPGLTATEARSRCEELARTIDDAVANDATLSGIAGLLWCGVSQFDGPETTPGPEGFRSEAAVEVGCRTRLT